MTNDATLAISGTAPDATLAYSLDGGATFSATPPTTADFGADGTKTVLVTATDSLGNTATSSLTFTLDTNADLGSDLAVALPLGSITSADQNAVAFTVSGLDSDTTAIVTFTDDANNTVTASTSSNGTSTVNLSALVQGQASVKITASDVAGNNASGQGATLSIVTPFTLSTASDTFVAAATGSVVNGTATTLTSGDSLTGGAGADVLALYGSGTYHIDQLAHFSDFETISLNNFTLNASALYLDDQSITVNETGSNNTVILGSGAVTIHGSNNSIIASVDAAHWNSGNVIDRANLLDLNGGQYAGANYDLTGNTFTNIDGIRAFGDNVTLNINSAAASGVSDFFSNARNGHLVTADATLDLSHTFLDGFTVTTTNVSGTDFLVKDISTAFAVAGGAGQDTISAQGFTFTADQRDPCSTTGTRSSSPIMPRSCADARKPSKASKIARTGDTVLCGNIYTPWWRPPTPLSSGPILRTVRL